jgi:predicted nucleotidyltransferase
VTRRGALLVAADGYSMLGQGAEKSEEGFMQSDHRLIKTIERLGDAVRARGATGLYLYGSRGRGDQRDNSDVDVFVDYDPSTDFSIVELAGIKRVLEGALGLEVHITTRDGLSPSFRRVVEDEAIRVL